jgi:hypothetical protein
MDSCMQMRSAMKKVFLFCAILLGFLQGWTQNFEMDTIYFEFDRYDLNSSDQYLLDSMIGIVTGYNSYFIQIYGHTDSIGTEQYNLELSRLRAREIALYLVDQGVDLKRIEYEGLGTTKPVGSNLTYRGRRMNRRADLAFIYANDLAIPGQEDTIAEQVVEAPPEEISKDVPDTIYCDYAPFIIDPSKQTVIIAPQGSKFMISPNTLQTDVAEVTVEVNELFDRKDILKIGMPTVSKEGPLEAAGMVSFSARNGRRQVNISTQDPVKVHLPATRRDADMAAYFGTGGSRGGRSRGRSDQPTFQPVNGWNVENDIPVEYLGREKAYDFELNKSGRFAIARPLYHSQKVGADDLGVDFAIKFKGKVFPRTTKATIMGETVKTYIPLKRKDKRNYTATNVKFLDPARTDLVIFAYQYDDKGNPWVAQREFKVGEVVSRKKSSKGRPVVKMKLKYRRTTVEEFNDLLGTL